ncbi:hypothetical protein GCM10011297_32460 [Bacterioplanes sanyensis]|uniref:hypothetical protein n=1 Tax=Bacterioplanes sanyensis TaxID=1249553 RepID=UPI00167A2DDA|nr:hypothetical protein [Bacterioplanes sanyensis]GGY57217.1 hypothetical protein GCM10011297_32460 [Bacterioplanes sanyensis]
MLTILLRQLFDVLRSILLAGYISVWLGSLLLLLSYYSDNALYQLSEQLIACCGELFEPLRRGPYWALDAQRGDAAAQRLLSISIATLSLLFYGLSLGWQWGRAYLPRAITRWRLKALPCLLIAVLIMALAITVSPWLKDDSGLAPDYVSIALFAAALNSLMLLISGAMILLINKGLDHVKPAAADRQ